MKKITIVVAIITMILVLNKQETVTIPKEAIRFRVIANSNTKADQDLKKKIVSNLQEHITTLEYSPKNIEQSRENIKASIPSFNKVIERTLQAENSNLTYNINYGMNYFPKKSYHGITYEAGEYESLVITLGNGLGENFWCILFPPLCLLEQTEENIEDVEYTSFVKEMLDKYF